MQFSQNPTNTLSKRVAWVSVCARAAGWVSYPGSRVASSLDTRHRSLELRKEAKQCQGPTPQPESRPLSPVRGNAAGPANLHLSGVVSLDQASQSPTPGSDSGYRLPPQRSTRNQPVAWKQDSRRLTSRTPARPCNFPDALHGEERCTGAQSLSV